MVTDRVASLASSDGVPYTLPDGQTTMDDIDPGDIASVEVMRGPTSTCYGNAGGRALLFSSIVPPLGHREGTRLEYGSFSGNHGLPPVLLPPLRYRRPTLATKPQRTSAGTSANERIMVPE